MGTTQFISVPYALCANDLSNMTRTISQSAFALSRSSTSTIITQNAGSIPGLLWQSNYQSSAYFIHRAPADWDTLTGATFRILFAESDNTSGNAGFFIRPLGMGSGTTVQPGSVGSLSNGTVSVSGTGYKVYEQTINIPASYLKGDWWEIGIQRLGSGPPAETYTADVVVIGVAVDYTAIR